MIPQFLKKDPTVCERRGGAASRSLWDRTERRESVAQYDHHLGGYPDLIGAPGAIRSMSPAAVERVRAFEQLNLAREQTPIATHHLIHAGMYARTITIPAGTVLTGALIKRATILIFNGDANVNGERVLGYHVVPASAHRKQAFYAHADTQLTMLFPTSAKKIEQAEEEFTDEAELLFSRNGENVINITGEL